MLIPPQWTINFNCQLIRKEEKKKNPPVIDCSLSIYSASWKTFCFAIIVNATWEWYKKEFVVEKRRNWDGRQRVVVEREKKICFCWWLKLCGTKNYVFFNYPSFHSRSLKKSVFPPLVTWRNARFRHRGEEIFMALFERRFNRSLIGFVSDFERIKFYFYFCSVRVRKKFFTASWKSSFGLQQCHLKFKPRRKKFDAIYVNRRVKMENFSWEL